MLLAAHLFDNCMVQVFFKIVLALWKYSTERDWYTVNYCRLSYMQPLKDRISYTQSHTHTSLEILVFATQSVTTKRSKGFLSLPAWASDCCTVHDKLREYSRVTSKPHGRSAWWQTAKRLSWLYGVVHFLRELRRTWGTAVWGRSIAGGEKTM